MNSCYASDGNTQLRHSIISQTIKALMRDRSNAVEYYNKQLNDEYIMYKKIIGVDAYSMIVCTMLHPPSRNEIKTMSIRMRETASLLIGEKVKAVDHVRLMITKIIKQKQCARDLANNLAGVISMNNKYAERWGVTERQYYRLIKKVDRLHAACVCKAFLLVDKEAKRGST